MLEAIRSLKKRRCKSLPFLGDGGKPPLAVMPFAAFLSPLGAPAIPLKCFLMHEALGGHCFLRSKFRWAWMTLWLGTNVPFFKDKAWDSGCILKSRGPNFWMLTSGEIQRPLTAALQKNHRATKGNRELCFPVYTPSAEASCKSYWPFCKISTGWVTLEN